MYGMYGPITDPGERQFTAMVKAAIPGIDVGRSPYRDYEVNQIVSDLRANASAIKIIWGSSLGANNCPVVSAYAGSIVIHGMWGFQASLYGSQVGIAANTLFAHEVMNPSIAMTGGLGAYKWTKAAGNHVTNLYISERYDFHPGETPQVEAMFIAEMKRVVAAAQAGRTP